MSVSGVVVVLPADSGSHRQQVQIVVAEQRLGAAASD